MIKVFLVEDEPPAMRKLERLVATQTDLVVCGAAGTCNDAIAGILETRPQLAILDVRLPDGTGFEVLQNLEEPQGLHVIFLTAFDQYALEAFDVAALDYLVKPVAQERFLRAIQRVRERLEKPPVAEASYARRFLVENRKAAYFLPVIAISRILSDRNYAILYSNLGEFTLRTTTDALQRRLDPAEFARVSRSAIVRVGAIREIRGMAEGHHVLFLTDGAEVVCSKRYWTAALERLL